MFYEDKKIITDAFESVQTLFHHSYIATKQTL